MAWSVKILSLVLGLSAGCAGAPTSDPEAELMADPGTDTATDPGADLGADPEGETVFNACLSDEQKALIGASAAEAQAILPETGRIVTPDGLITQDYQPRRVNVDLNAKGIVTRVWCG